MEKVNLTFGMTNMFNDYHSRRKQLEKEYEQENEQLEKQFWHDRVVMTHIPRHVYNISRRKYFGGVEERHNAALDALDHEYITGQNMSIYDNPVINLEEMDDVRKQYRETMEAHKQHKATALNNFFEGIPETHRGTIKQLYKMNVIDLEEAQDKQIKELSDKLFEDAGEPNTNTDNKIDVIDKDAAMHSLNPLRFNMLDKDMHVLNANELRYAEHLIAEFAKNNKAKVSV